jgi:membrane protease YdiL (CAAX protease family)
VKARGGPLKRLAVFVGLAALALLVAQAVLARAGGPSYGGADPSGLEVYFWTLAAGLLMAHAGVLGLFHERSWSYVGLDVRAASPSKLALGGLIGALAIGVPSGLLLIAGQLQEEPSYAGSTPLAMARLLVLLAPAALWEELALRGYLLSGLRERFGANAALIVTSALFGLLHLQNAGATAWSTAAVTLAGGFLGMVRFATGSLYAAWAAHLAWNFVMAGILHAPVSGLGMTAPNYRIVDAGPDWLTGGPWGPEGGAAAMLGMAVAFIYLQRRPRREEPAS